MSKNYWRSEKRIRSHKRERPVALDDLRMIDRRDKVAVQAVACSK